MKPTLYLLPATLAFGLMSAQFATASNTTPPVSQRVIPIDAPPPEGSAAEAAQLQREHLRAVAAGDHENDPFNTASSDALNQSELSKAVALGNGPVYVTDETLPDNATVEALPPSDDSATVPPDDATAHPNIQ